MAERGLGGSEEMKYMEENAENLGDWGCPATAGATTSTLD